MGIRITATRQQRWHREGSHFSLTRVGFPVLFSPGDVSTDVVNPFSRHGWGRTSNRSLRRRLHYPLCYVPISKERSRQLRRSCSERSSVRFPSQLVYYRPSWSERQPSSTGTSPSTSSDTEGGSGSFTPIASRYSIAP